MNIFSFKLATEAKLLGSWAFILKASLAMLAAFALGRHIPLANRDMISFLFAMMLSLEPVSATGFKRGLDQFRATLIGGLLSGLIVAVVGINPFGLALSIATILYFTLAQDWRNLSVVALFTGIYMTQFLQLAPDGTPDILLTMLVRILALTAGIVFAMIFNALVSVAYMRRLPHKRMAFLYYRTNKHLQRLLEKLSHQLPLRDDAYLSMANLFNDIDWNTQLLRDLSKDPLLVLGRLDTATVHRAIARAEALRRFSHYLFDLELQLRDEALGSLPPDVQKALLQDLQQMLQRFAKRSLSWEHAAETPTMNALTDDVFITPPTGADIPVVKRIYWDLEACEQALD